MSYTVSYMVCDGCSKIVANGARRHMKKTLAQGGGRAFRKLNTERLSFKEMDQADWLRTDRQNDRHLCGECTGLSVFADGVPVPDGEKR